MKDDPNNNGLEPRGSGEPEESGRLYSLEEIFREAMGKPCCRKKRRQPTEREALLLRLSRLEGQIRGIGGMVEKDAYCTDILTQVAAAQSALNAFAREILNAHIRTCVVQDIQAGRTEVVDDLVAAIQKLMK